MPSDTINPDAIVPTLNKAQLATVLALGADGVMLGCSEATARRLGKPTTKRPALVNVERGEECPMFSLNASGFAVKAAALRMGYEL